MPKKAPKFGGPAILLDRNDINTDEIIPAKYLTELTKIALKPHLLEDLLIDGKPFDNNSEQMKKAKVVITRKNFGCGSSREHAVWAFEVNDIKVIIGQKPIARIFRQNAFNCGILAIELPRKDIINLFLFAQSNHNTTVVFNEALTRLVLIAYDEDGDYLCKSKSVPFTLNQYDRSLIKIGGWLAYADKRY